MDRKAIICVDDEKVVLDSLKIELKTDFQDKYIIEFAESGEEALEIIDDISEEKTEIALIISDYIMPEMKGDEFLHKAKELLPNTYNIMLTGQATIEGVTNAINDASLYRYIAKPWEVNDLKLTVSKAIESYENDRLIEEQNEEIRRQNVEIMAQNEEISEMNKNLDKLVKKRTIQLEHKIEELLKVRMGKKAFIILFIVTIAAFLAVDLLLEPILTTTLQNIYILIFIKLLIAIMVKPIESMFEKFLLTKARLKMLKSNEKGYE